MYLPQDEWTAKPQNGWLPSMQDSTMNRFSEIEAVGDEMRLTR